MKLLLLVPLLLGQEGGHAGGGRAIVVGSKSFNESYILAEMMALLLEENGFTARRRFGLEGTMMAFEALRLGEIDVYPEYPSTRRRSGS